MVNNSILGKKYLFLKSFFVIIIIEFTILVNIFNDDLFIFKVLINYLFLIGIIPFILEKISRGSIDIFSPIAIFTFFYLLLFGFRPIDILIFNKHLIQADEKFYNWALFYAIIGLHLFQIGYFSRIGFAFFNSHANKSSEWSLNKIKIIALVFGAVAFFSFLTILTLSGGLIHYFHNLRNALISITAGKTIIFILVVLIKIPVLIWFCYIAEKKNWSIGFFIYFVFALFLLASLGERGHFVSLILSMLVCYYYIGRRIRTISIIFVALSIILFLVIYGKYRDYTQQDSHLKKSGIEINIGFKTIYHYFMGHFDQVRHLKDVVKYVPEKLEYQYGKTFINFIVKPIPSVFWHDKPLSAGRIVTKNLYPRAYSTGMSVAPSLLSELYLNFHVIGIILGLLLFGILSRTIYLPIIKRQKSKNRIVIYAFLIPYIFSELRGDFAVTTSFLLFNFVFLVLAIKYVSINYNDQH